MALWPPSTAMLWPLHSFSRSRLECCALRRVLSAFCNHNRLSSRTVIPCSSQNDISFVTALPTVAHVPLWSLNHHSEVASRVLRGSSSLPLRPRLHHPVGVGRCGVRSCDRKRARSYRVPV